MKRILPIAVCAIFLLPLLGGCGMIRAKFGNKSDAYKNSTQTRPLEVPPDLDSPNRTGALVIPGPSASTGTAVSVSAAPAAIIVPSSAPPLEAQSLAGEGFQVADSLANTWRRTGLALERSGVATIQSRDEAARTYEISAGNPASAHELISNCAWIRNRPESGRLISARATAACSACRPIPWHLLAHQCVRSTRARSLTDRH